MAIARIVVDPARNFKFSINPKTVLSRVPIFVCLDFDLRSRVRSMDCSEVEALSYVDQGIDRDIVELSDRDHLSWGEVEFFSGKVSGGSSDILLLAFSGVNSGADVTAQWVQTVADICRVDISFMGVTPSSWVLDIWRAVREKGYFRSEQSKDRKGEKLVYESYANHIARYIREIAEAKENKKKKVICVAHSWGAKAVALAAQQLDEKVRNRMDVILIGSPYHPEEREMNFKRVEAMTINGDFVRELTGNDWADRSYHKTLGLDDSLNINLKKIVFDLGLWSPVFMPHLSLLAVVKTVSWCSRFGRGLIDLEAHGKEAYTPYVLNTLVEKLKERGWARKHTLRMRFEAERMFYVIQMRCSHLMLSMFLCIHENFENFPSTNSTLGRRLNDFFRKVFYTIASRLLPRQNKKCVLVRRFRRLDNGESDRNNKPRWSRVEVRTRRHEEK